MPCQPPPFLENVSTFRAVYLHRAFFVPIYPWEALEPFWADIALSISKALIYHKFSGKCYRDSRYWQKKQTFRSKQDFEALRFADLLSRDRGFSRAVRDFNKQYGVDRLAYGEWLEPFHGDTPNWTKQLTQVGQLIYNAMHFLRKTEYIRMHSLKLGRDVLRPYWAPIREATLMRQWFKDTCNFIIAYFRYTSKYPPLRDIARFWGVPRYTLIESDLTRTVVYDVYRHWRKTGEIKLLKPKKEYKLLTAKEREVVAQRIVGRFQ